MSFIFRFAFKNITKKWLDVLLLVIGTMVSTALITGFFVVNDSFTHYNLQKLDKYFGDVDVVISKEGIPFIPQNFDKEYVLGILRNEQDVSKTLGIVQIDVIFENPLDPSKATSAKMMGVNFEEFEKFTGKKIKVEEEQIILGEHLAKLLNVGLEDKVVVRNPLKNVTLKISGIGEKGILNFRGASGNTNGVGIVSEDTARNLNMIPAGSVTDVFVCFDKGIDSKTRSKIVDRLRKKLKGFNVYDVKTNLLKNPSNRYLGYFVLLFGGFSIAAACFLTSNFFTMLFNERKKDLAILKTFGFQRNRLFSALFAEGLIYVIISSFSGATFGLLISRFLLGGFKNIKMPLSDIFSLSFNGLEFYVKPISVFYSILMGMLLPLGILFFYSRKFSKKTVLQMMKQNPDVEDKNSKNYFLPVFSMILGIILLLFGKGFTNFIGINIILLGFPFFFEKRFLYILLSLTSMVFTYFSPHLYKNQVISEILVNLTRGGFYMVSSIMLVVHSSYFIRKIFEFFLSKSPAGILNVRNGFAYVSANPKKATLNMMIFGIMIFGMVVTMTVPYNIMSFVSEKVSDGFLGYDFAVIVNPIKNMLNIREMSMSEEKLKESFQRLDRVILVPIKVKGEDEKSRDSIAAFIEPEEGEIPPVVLHNTVYSSIEETWKFFNSTSNDSFFAISGVVPFENDSFHSLDLNERIEVSVPRSIFQIQNPNLPLSKFKIIANYKIQENFIPVEFLLPMKALPKNFKGGFVVYLGKLRKDSEASSVNSLKLDITKDMNFPIYLTEEFGKIYENLNFFVDLGVSLLYFGLITGFSGLVITIIRSINLRKRNIATLKAIGIKPSKISAGFIIESSFIVICGILIGTISGLVESFDLTTGIIKLFGQSKFMIPAVKLLVLMGTIYLFAFFASFIPSTLASKIPPAENLKIFD